MTTDLGSFKKIPRHRLEDADDDDGEAKETEESPHPGLACPAWPGFASSSSSCRLLGRRRRRRSSSSISNPEWEWREG